MADFYYKSDVAGVGSGTLADPYRDLSSGPVAANNRYFFHSASIWSNTGVGSSGFFPSAKMLQNNVQFLAYGPSGSLPTFSGLRTVTSGSWTFDPTTETYWTTVTYGGHVLRGGQMLKMFHWPPGTLFNGGISSIISSMPYDSFTLDYESSPNRMYIRLSGSINDATLEVSDTEVIMNTNPSGTGSYSGVVVDSLAFRGASRSAIFATTHSGIQLRNLNIQFCGGKRNSTLGNWQGHGVELSVGTDGAVVDSSIIGFTYTSPIIIDPNDSVGTNINNITVQNNSLFQAGRAGVETSVSSSSCSINNLLVTSNVIENIGLNNSTWKPSPGDVGTGIRLTADAVSSGVSGSYLSRNRISNCGVGISVQSRNAATNTAVGNLIVNASSRNTAGFVLYNGSGASTLNTYGNTVHNVERAYDSDDTAGVPALLRVYNTTIVQSSTGFRINNQHLIVGNSTIQGAQIVLTGQILTVTSIKNYFASTVDFGQYILGSTDEIGPNISFDSTTNFMPVSGSRVLTGGIALDSSSYADYSGGLFGTSSVWSRCSAAYYQSLSYQQPLTPTLVPGNWFPLQTAGRWTWAYLLKNITTDVNGFFIFFE